MMTYLCRGAGPFVAVAFLVTATLDGASSSSSTKSGTGSVPSRASSTKGGTSRGSLPDPVLLDGSAHPVEKKSEHGMIGDFELPGDDNVKNGKVGGPQGQPPPQGGGLSANIPGLPPPPGGQQGQQGQQGGQQGGMPQAGGQQGGGQQAGGAQAGGPQNPAAAGNPIAGAGDQGAQAQGIQVAELGGEASGQGTGGAGPAEKPQQVAIGDSAMRIEPTAGQAGVVGGQQQVAGKTQQHEKGTGSGGKGTGGAGGGNRIEKGRTIPAGL